MISGNARVRLTGDALRGCPGRGVGAGRVARGGAAMTPEQRAAILAPTKDFTAAERWEALSGGTATNRTTLEPQRLLAALGQSARSSSAPTSSSATACSGALGERAGLDPGRPMAWGRSTMPAAARAAISRTAAATRRRGRTTARSRCSCGCRSRRRTTPSATCSTSHRANVDRRADLRRPAAGPGDPRPPARGPHGDRLCGDPGRARGRRGRAGCARPAIGSRTSPTGPCIPRSW